MWRDFAKAQPGFCNRTRRAVQSMRAYAKAADSCFQPPAQRMDEAARPCVAVCQGSALETAQLSAGSAG